MTAPPPPPPDEPVDPTLVGPSGGRRVVVDEDAPPPRVVRPYPWWLWWLVGLLLAAAILFLVLWLLERNDSGNEVPSLVGLTQAEAQDRASAKGFTLETIRRAAGAPAGQVVDQAPQSGAELEEGAQVMAVVSAGQAQATVPKLVGSTADASEQLLTAQGLETNRKTVESAKPKGIVVAQDPDEGEQLPKGSTVTISVSNGEGQVKVPAVQGMSQADAVAAVVDAGLTPVVIQVPSQKPEGTVIAQDPPANQQATAQAKVRMNVSGGPASTQTLTVTTSETTTETTRTATTVTTTTP
ncbi:MAG: PASTA domain-containing protein [Gaiellaceae bacterium]